MSFGGQQGGGSGGAAVGGIAGGIIGAFTPVGPVVGFAIGSVIGGIIGSLVAPPKSPEQSPPSGITDLYITSIALGKMIPIVRGAFPVPGSIIDATKKHSIVVEVESGSTQSLGKGKGGGGGSITSERQYFISLDIALCEGPIQRVPRIWADLDLWYDETADFGKIEHVETTSDYIMFRGVFTDDESPVAIDTLTVYFGSSPQIVDPTFEEVHGIGTTPTYPGIAHAVFKDLALGNAGRVPTFMFEVVKDDTFLDSIQDIFVTDLGLYAVYAKSIFSKRTISLSIECNITNDAMLHLTTIARVDGGSFTEDGFSLGSLKISNSPAGNNGSFTVRSVSMSSILIAGDLEDEVDVTVVLSQSVRDANSVGSIVSYNKISLMALTRKDTGINPTALIVGSVANSNDQVYVLNYGTLDGLDSSNDTLSYYFGGVNLETTDLEESELQIPLRTGSEITDNVVLQSHLLATDNMNRIFITHDSIPALSRFSNFGTVDRVTIGAVATGLVVANNSVWVLLSDDSVEKRNAIGLGTITLQDIITLPSGASLGRIIAASDNRIWVSNVFDGSVTHFTTNGDKVDVAVLDAPIPLAEASDTYIWVASGSEATIVRIDPTDDSFETFSLPYIVSLLAKASSGKMWAATTGLSSNILLIDVDGTYIEIKAPPGITKIVSDSSGYCYAMSADSRTIFAVDNLATQSILPATESGLACVVRYFALRAGVPDNQIDVNRLDNTPVNMVLSEVQSARNVIQQLADTFLFSGVESEGILKFFYHKNIDVLASVSSTALNGGINKQDTKMLSISRSQELELPTAVTVTALDISRNYGEGTKTAKLTTGRAGPNPQVLRLPYALTYQQINFIAQNQLLTPWIRRERGEFTLTPMLMLLEPGDGIQVSARSITYTFRISEKTSAHNWLDTIRVEGYDNLVYDEIPNVEIPDDIVPVRKLPSEALAIILDLPPLNSTTVTLRYFVGYYRLSTMKAFLGAGLFQSLDSGTSYSAVHSQSSEAVTGLVASALPYANPNVWDDTNVITVVMRNGELSTASELDVLNGANRFFLGLGSIVEICHFTVATLIAANTYELSHLLRGRKGTESFCALHGSNENFVLLNSIVTNTPVTYSAGIIAMSENYKTVTASKPIEETSASTFTLNGRSIKPWAPVLQDAVRDTPSADDVTFSFVARSRLQDLPIGVAYLWDIDSTKSFNLIIYEDGTYTTVKRTFTIPPSTNLISVAITQVYTAAQQTTDFGSPQSSIYYGVLEIASVLGYESRSVA